MTVLDLVLIVLLGVLIVIIILQWHHLIQVRNKQRDITTLLSSLERERPALAEMIRYIEDDEARQLIRQRTELIERLLAAAITGDPVRNNAVFDEVDRLVGEPAEFMRQTRLIYERLQPVMIARLRESDLTDEEIEVCCLYALGLNGKSIQQYTRDGRHYQNVGIIRKKLGLGEHDKNIDGYIRSLLR